MEDKVMALGLRSLGKIGAVLAVALAIVLIAAAGFGTYFWRQSRINSLSDSNRQLESQLDSMRNTNQQLNRQLEALQNKPASSPQPTPTFSYQSAKGVTVQLYAPASNTTIASPVAVVGQVPGNWSSEAQFPIKLEDQNGNVVAQTTAHVLGDWMTTKLVPFSAQLTYSAHPAGSGWLVLVKDNPSGLPANQDSVTVPVQF